MAAPRTPARHPRPAPLHTPDGRYIVVRGRLWRTSNPGLGATRRQEIQHELMSARRAVRQALQSGAQASLKQARARVHAAKVALGERGPVWWQDGAQDYNRHLARNSPYAQWYAEAEGAAGPGR